MEFFSARIWPDPSLLEIMNGIGNQIDNSSNGSEQKGTRPVVRARTTLESSWKIMERMRQVQTVTEVALAHHL
jgi:hypothetical protein